MRACIISSPEFRSDEPSNVNSGGILIFSIAAQGCRRWGVDQVAQIRWVEKCRVMRLVVCRSVVDGIVMERG